MKFLAFIFFSLVLYTYSYSQTNDTIVKCQIGDSLYENPQFGCNLNSLQKYIYKNAFPILSDYTDSADFSYKIFYVYIEISEYGKVESVYIPEFMYPDECKNKLSSMFLNMNVWKPAKCNDIPIKSKKLIRIEYARSK